MTSVTKELAQIMLVDNVSLNLDQIKKVDDINKKRSSKLRVYLKLLSINKKLSSKNLKKLDK
jgi:hypothetical protein